METNLKLSYKIRPGSMKEFQSNEMGRVGLGNRALCSNWGEVIDGKHVARQQDHFGPM